MWDLAKDYLFSIIFMDIKNYKQNTNRIDSIHPKFVRMKAPRIKEVYICECVYMISMTHHAHFGNRPFINRQGGGVEVSFYLHLSTGYFRASRFFHQTMREYRSRWAGTRFYLPRAIRNKLGAGRGETARGDKAIPTIPPDADWRARASCYSNLWRRASAVEMAQFFPPLSCAR